MPVKNAGRYLAPAINSILEQSHHHLQLLIVNDCSDDGSLEQAKTQFNDPRITFADSPSQGIIAALNYGVKIARYDLIARMDGDDIAHPERLRTQLNYLAQNPHIDIVGAQVRLFRDSQPLGEGYARYQAWINQLCDHESISRHFFVESAIAHPTALFSKETFSKLGGYQDKGWPEDYDLWCRAFVAGMKFGKPEGQVLLHWRDHNQRASRAQSRYEKTQFLSCKAHYIAKFLKQKNKNQCSIWGTGPTGLKLHDLLEANGITITHFHDINPKLKNKTKRGKPITVLENPANLSYDNMSQTLCIAAVSARGASAKLEHFFNSLGLTANQHYLLAA